ncbi:class I SAM-dependent methyltransferase [Mycolicibacterium sp. P1-18]|uniref:class I SAM-dependent methyltransferase n=1 Tax=Mycolicibacterium sp. P1-18 TaxID=2024615 RepID=UPI0011F12A1A|nr:class I SAM-dependent methyltransferase [Mycolicibacterium sp. P1-18]KAA0098052.1 class I SAM-dependent methyltransferase [Mycolicibacterium sp. P1-18]
MWAGGRYESVAERIAVIAGETVAAADRRQPLPGTALVDLACGTGSAALAAAERGAVVTGVDLTPELVAIAQRHARSAGHDVTWVIADATETTLPEQSFDAAVSNMGIIFVEPRQQVAEIARLLKPAGVLAFSAWKRTGGNPLFDPIVEALGPQPERAFTPDQWGDPAIATERLAADFTDVEIHDGTLVWAFDSLDAARHFVRHESPMHVDLFGRLDRAAQDRLLSAFTDALTPDVGDDGGVRFDAPYAVITATRR